MTFYKQITPKQKKNRGSALVIAIFILTVMLLLGVTLMELMSKSGKAVVYEVLGTRAYSAAQTGLQWQLQRIFPLNSTSVSCAVATGTIPQINIISGLQNCQITTLSCNDFTHDSITYYTVTSTGQCGSADNVVTSRTLQVEARSL